MEKNLRALFQKNLDKLIKEYLNKQIFSACSLGFFTTEKEKKCKEFYYYGKTGIGSENILVCEKTLFDLASLTKPLVTSLVFLFLLNKGIVTYEDTLEKFFKGVSAENNSINLYNLLTHTSGLPAHQSYFQELVKLPFNERKKYFLKKILFQKLCFSPGKGCLYSDLGFILLGFILEKVTGENLDVFWEKNIIQPLKIPKELFFANKNISNTENFAETGYCPWFKKKLKGSVHDDNCRALGGVAGHAGLFGTTPALLSFVEKIMLEIKGVNKRLGYNKEILNTFNKRQKQSTWVNGFDTPSTKYSSSGKHFSNSTFGHLGFTGTSFWIDIKKECGVVFLTNRVLCCEDLGSIRKLRPLIHNIVMSYMSDQKDKLSCKNLIIRD